MIESGRLDFDLEILSCIKHLKIFKVCREGYYSLDEEEQKTVRLYEVFEHKDPVGKSANVLVKPLPGYKYIFSLEALAQPLSKIKDNIADFDTFDTPLYLNGDQVFIGVENGNFVFFNRDNLVLIKIK